MSFQDALKALIEATHRGVGEGTLAIGSLNRILSSLQKADEEYWLGYTGPEIEHPE